MNILLTHTVNPDARDWGNKTPLTRVAWHGHQKMVALLLETCVLVNAYDPCRRCTLSLAVEYVHTEVVRIFLAHPQIKPDPSSRR